MARLLVGLAVAITAPAAFAAPSGPTTWADLARLPDWSGIWTPDPADKFGRGTPPWTPEAAARIAALQAAEKAGHPDNMFVDCLPEGMPTYMLMTLNALEFLFTPGRITILGEFDGNRLRRIYTDGRAHPDDPDLTFNGHSIGHWEGDTLVVDTVGILPEVFLPLGQAVAIPNDGDMHIVEHLRLSGPDRLTDQLEITAPHQLKAPWKIERSFLRHRGQDIVEASCLQGNYVERRDTHGDAVFVPIPHGEGGAPLPIADAPSGQKP